MPYIFRTYEPPIGARDEVYEKLRSDPRHHPSSIPLHKVARATAAAPAYFRPIRILPAMRFKDGGFGCNNPSEEAYRDIVEAHGGLSRNVGPFVSIGTGVGKFRLFSDKQGHLRDACANALAAMKRPALTTLVDKFMAYNANYDREKRFPYYRFDGGEVLGEVAMDEWKSHDRSQRRGRGKQHRGAGTLERIQRAVAAYLALKSVRRDLEDCAKLLVQRRQRRTGDPARWERYATGSYYECGDRECGKARFETSREFGEHVGSVHGVEGGGVRDERMEEGRGYGWLYPG